jgi:hypothetical protein
MSSRERLLLVVVLICLGLAVLSFGGRSVAGLFASLNSDLESTRQEIEDKELTKRRMDLDIAFMAKQLERSLSNDPFLARTKYRSWLFKLADESGLQDFKIPSTLVVPVGKTYYRHTFRITGTTDLKKTVEFLHAFYSAPLLHRFQTLSLTPGAGKEIALAGTIEVIGLVDAPKDPTIGEEPVIDVLIQENLQDYVSSIVRRNLFGLPNKKPTFSGTSIVRLTIGEDEEFNISANAAERDQKIVSYEMIKTDLDPAPVISRTGKVTLRSDEEGSFDLTVRVTDDGFPEKTEERTYKLRFEPKKVAAAPPETPKFDNAQLAFFTGTVQIGDVVEAWILRRDKGKLIKLHVGDKLQIGTVTGEVIEITFKTIQIDTEEGSLVIKHGQNLSEATMLSSVESN